MGKSAFIFANGEITDREAVRVMLQEEDLVVAADGGLRHLRLLGLEPSLLVGDLDSVDAGEVQALEARGIPVLRYPVEKDATDLELALEEVLRRGCTRITIAGALGGRLDHTLGNLALLTSPALAEIQIKLVDGRSEVILIRKSVEIEGRRGDVVSLIPFGQPAKGVTATGLKYPLRAATLYPYQTRGVSNEMLGPCASVRLTGGLLLCIHSRQISAGTVVFISNMEGEK